MSKRIWLSPPHMGGNELKYIKAAFSENWIAPIGPNVDGFEDDLSRYLDIDNVVALSSGTAAIHLALICLGIQKGEYVLCSSFTFAATANPITYIGANPVFIDAEPESWNMSPELLEKSIKELIHLKKKPAAIILVHLYGMPSKIGKILGIASEYDIPVIEDAAEALGSSYKGQKLGSFGDIGILSFNGNKIITTSGGGALVSKNPEYVENARFRSAQAREQAPHYEHSQIGYNYRMSNIIAGIGRGQMEVIDDRVLQRRAINEMYRHYLTPILDKIDFQSEWSAECYSNFWLTTLTFLGGYGTRERVRLALEKENIEARPLWKPMHLQPVFKASMAYHNACSDDLFRNGLCLPSGSSLQESDIRRIAEIIIKQV